MTFEIVNADEVPSWALQPLAPHVADAIEILFEAMDSVRSRRVAMRLQSAICYLWNQPPSDTEWLGQMGIAGF